MKLEPIGVLQAAWLGAVSLVLTACGGGGSSGGGGGNGAGSGPPPPPPPPPTASISALPAVVIEGGSTQLTWSSTNADSCLASGSWTGTLATSGTRTIAGLAGVPQFILSCSGSGGTASAHVTVNVILPEPSLTLEATPGILRGTQTALLTWSSVRVTGCEATGPWSGPRPTSGSETVGPFVQADRLFYSLECVSATGGPVNERVLVEYRTGTNLPPIANAGPDQVAGSTHRVELSALFSDDDYDLASSTWRQTGGTPVTLGPGFSLLNASFMAPTVTTDTVLTFELMVTDDEGLTSAPDSVNVTVEPIPPTVTISGDIQYENVPAVPLGQGLNYALQGFSQISDVLVEVLDATTQSVVASGTFAGDFQFTVPSQTDLRLRATAQSSRQAPLPLPHWQISVRDLDANGAPLTGVYSYTGAPFNSGAGGRQSLQIPSGWNSAGQLVGTRAAAPFGILDSIRLMLNRKITFTQLDLPALTIDWAPSNPGGETFYARDPAGHRIVLAGEVDVDTDEYDSAVILHEFSHYVLSVISRDDSIGGPHGFGDKLDMRVAFSEGFATAFGAFASGQAVYEDTFGPGQGDSAFFSLDVDQTLNEGWFSEFSVQEILYDFGDSGVWAAIQGPLRQTDALTSVFPFFEALKVIDPSRAAYLDSLVAGELIVGSTINSYGSTETNNGGTLASLPIYTSIALGGSVQVPSTNDFGTGNKLGNHRYLRFSLPSTTNVRFQVSATAGKDPDMAIFRRGVPLGPPQGPASEDFSLVLDAGEYVLDVYECGNAGCNPGVTPGPVNITVAVSAN